MGSPGERPFVGRSAELAGLARHLAAAADGAGRIVLVTGEAGIGKTRIVEQALSEVPATRALWGRCHESPRCPAYWPWIEALRRLVETITPDALARALGSGAAEVARVLPPIRDRLPGIAPPSADPTDANEARFRLFDAIARFLCAVADEPLVVVIDDLHWADAESLLLLRFLGPEIRRSRLLVLATCREEEMRDAGGLPHILGDLVRLADRVPLSGLTAAEIEEYARSSAGTGASSGVVSAIHRASGGNALFVGELVDLLARDGLLAAPAIRVDQLTLPAGVRDAVLRRLARLDADARRVLEVAAVAGPEFEVAVVSRAAGLEVGEAVKRLSPSLDGRILAYASAIPGRLAFVHDLVGDALRAELAPETKAAFHRSLADAIEAVHAHSIDEVAGEIARHLVEAGPSGDLARAMEHAARAGKRALRLRGYDEAARHYERAVHASRAIDVDPRVRLDLEVRLAAARLAADDDHGARSAAVEAARLARELGDVRRLAQAGATASAARSETGQADHELIELLEEAVRRMDPDDHAGLAFVLPPCSRELYFVDRARRHALSEAALAHARALGDPLLLGSALGARHLALWEPGRAEERRELADAELALAEETQDFQLAMHAHAWRIADLLELGEIDAVNDALTRYEALAERRRLPRLSWHVAVARASRAFRLGHLDEAERLATGALSIWRPGPQNNVLQFYAIQLFLIRAEQGRLAELDESLQAMAAASVVPAWRAALAWLHATLGRRDQARAVLGELVARGIDMLPLDGNWVPTMIRLAMTCALLEDAALAGDLLPRLAPFSRYNVVIGAGVACLGSVERYVGVLALTTDRIDEAIAHLEAALEANRRGRFHAQVAHVQAELARALRRSGAEERARALEAEAAASARGLGLDALLSDLERGGAPHDRPARTVEAKRGAPPAASALALLQREGDVWTIEHGEEITRVRDMKGVQYLVHLLRHPGREFHALDVVGSDVEEAEDAGPSAGAGLREARRERLADLREELAEAEEFNDLERADRLRGEMEELAEELSRATGLGGTSRSRRAGSIAERARLNATRAIRKVIARIETDCPRLGRHLSSSVQTGRICTYREDPTFPVTWKL